MTKKEGLKANSYFTKKITLLMVLFTALIVILHAKSPERFGLDLGWNFPLIYVVSQFCRIAVPSFFFISALLFYRNCDFKDIGSKLLRRIHTLLVPYLLWNLFFVIVFLVLTHVPFFSEKMRIGASLSSFSQIFLAVIDSHHSDLWFVKDLMIFSLMAPCLWLINRNTQVSVILFLLSLILSIALQPPYKSVLTWFPCYFLGTIIGCNYDCFTKELALFCRRSYVYIVMLIILLILFIVSFLGPRTESIFVQSSPLFVWILIDMFRPQIELNFTIKKWMSYMFFIYVTHHFTLNVLQKIVVLVSPPTEMVIYMTYFISPIITFYLLIKIATSISHTKFYKIMCGSR